MNKIMEYMYFGLPIVAYDLTENRISAESAAVYAEANDERELAGRIADLLDDLERREKMGAIGCQRLHDHLAWEHSAPSCSPLTGGSWPGERMRLPSVSP